MVTDYHRDGNLQRSKKRKRKPIFFSEWAEDDQKTARPSDYGIMSLDKLLNTQGMTECYTYCRVSSRSQNLPFQVIGSRRRLKRLGIHVIFAFSENTTGKSLDPNVRPELYRALQAARRRGVPLVIPAISRLVRSGSYHAHFSPNDMPTIYEFEAALALAEGVTLVTMNDPDADPPSDEAYLRELQAEVKRRPVGRRPRKAQTGCRQRRKNQWLSRILSLRNDGLSYRQIADQLYVEGVSITPKTIWQWVEENA